jgi:TonB family protein
MMIPRLLVPYDARPPAAEDSATQRRRPTTLDERRLIPAMLPIVYLDGRSNIPTDLPLESIVARVVVPRDVKHEGHHHDDRSTAIPLQPTDMDARITVPQGSAPPEISPRPLHVPGDLVNADIILTGEVHLLDPPDTVTDRRGPMVTFAFHILLLLSLILGPKIFPEHQPANSDEIDRQQVTLVLPPGALDAAKTPPQPKELKSEAIRVDPRIIRKVAPPVVPEPLPTPKEPDRVVKNLPNAPTPQVTDRPPVPQPNTPAPKMETPLKLETPDQQPKLHGLVLPTESAGRSIEESARAATKMSNPRITGGDLPGGATGGGGHAQTGAGIEMLTTTDGVDFSNYLQRVYITVRNNWYAVMPPSVQLGDRGKVVLTFRITTNGSVPSDEPVREEGSGKEPLDRAAISSIRASNPFEPLPSAFKRPYIELRFSYYYNIPPEFVH